MKTLIKIIFQKRHINKELKGTAYCEKHGLFTEAYPNEMCAQDFHKDFLKEKIKSFLEIIYGELGKFARKDDLEILSKQAKMFQPLDFVRKSDLKKLKEGNE